MTLQDENGRPIFTVDELLGYLDPEPLHCSNNCDHGCDIPLQPGTNRIGAALANGWTVVLWTTPEQDNPEHHQHTLMFCDPGCLYEHWRARMQADPHWSENLQQMDARAYEQAKVIAEEWMHRHISREDLGAALERIHLKDDDHGPQ